MIQPSPVRFKFLFGEWHLGSWRPLMQPGHCAVAEAPAEWPLQQEVERLSLDARADGFWYRHASVSRFPLGLSRVGNWCCYVPRLERLYCLDTVGKTAI